MALNYADKRLEKYFDALFVIGRIGDSNKELFVLHSTLPTEDYNELKKFNDLHKSLIELVSRDEGEYITQKEFALLEEYEKTADQINIAPRYKAKMYDAVLIGTDKFAPSNTSALSLLSKIVDNTSNSQLDHLKLLQRQAKQYQYGAFETYKKLDEKINLKMKRKNPQDVDSSRTRFEEISAELKTPHSTEEKIALLKEQLNLADKCAFKKMIKFKTKASIYHSLSNEYASQRDIFNHDESLRESQYYQKLVQNIINHSK